MIGYTYLTPWDKVAEYYNAHRGMIRSSNLECVMPGEAMNNNTVGCGFAAALERKRES